MDGADKAYRNVCAAKPEKVRTVGELNHFNCCVNSPLPGKLFCAVHLNDKAGETSIRLDHGVLTRARRKELGLEIDCLSSTVGCRKPDKVMTRCHSLSYIYSCFYPLLRSKRSKTAGMLYALRPCGIVLGHLECVHAGKSSTLYD